jgi:hypothetical protein
MALALRANVDEDTDVENFESVQRVGSIAASALAKRSVRRSM